MTQYLIPLVEELYATYGKMPPTDVLRKKDFLVAINFLHVKEYVELPFVQMLTNMAYADRESTPENFLKYDIAQILIMYRHLYLKHPMTEEDRIAAITDFSEHNAKAFPAWYFLEKTWHANQYLYRIQLGAFRKTRLKVT